jgi:nucleoside-diphosphate-sugar epimerase
VLDSPRGVVHNEVFNIGRTDENYQVRQIAEAIASVIPSASIEYAGKGGPDARNYRVNFDKAARLLPGFQPQWTVRTAVEELLQLCERERLAVDDIATTLREDRAD